MTPGFPRRVRYAAALLALCALAGVLAGGGASAAGPQIPIGVGSFVRTCNEPLPDEAACLALRRTNGVVASVPDGVNPAVAVSGYGPSDLAGAYNVPTTLGAGKTVAIVDAYDAPSAESDLAVY